MKTLLLILLSVTTWATTLEINHSNYENGKKGANRIVFNMESTKAGMITTSFQGVVKKASLNYNKQEQGFSDIELTVPVKQIDTDNDARNDKMYDKCFSANKFSDVKVKFSEMITYGKKQAKGSILIRGKWFPITIDVDVKSASGKTTVNGSAKLSLKGLEIPDPSIWIASVRDLVELEFVFNL